MKMRNAKLWRQTRVIVYGRNNLLANSAEISSFRKQQISTLNTREDLFAEPKG
jgi:hypothetical protein